MRPVDAPGRRSGRSAVAVASSPRARAWPAVHRHRRNNGAAGAAINTLVAVQGLWIIAASVTLRLLRPPAAAAPPARSGSKVARPGHEQHEHRDLRRRGRPASPARPEPRFSGPVTLRYGRPV